jgi:DNA polymerase-3 subunit alpha (Gram-positive type)
MPISERITQLTSITDEDVKDAPVADEVVPKFLEFAGDSVLVAHNAGFDVGFIRTWAESKGIVVDNTVIDTVELGKTMLTDLKNYKLDTLCEALDVSLEHHHRAVDDAEATAELFIKLSAMLKDCGIACLDEINVLASERIDKRSIKKYYHIIIFAKNLVGLKNLYALVSDAHIKYYLKKPKFPKSELIKHRDGLIFGSACEAGDLYTAVYDNRSDSELREIVEFYDYLEIQPLGNDRYMINNQNKSGKSVENEERLIEINKRIVALGEQYNKPVVATCDCHFIDPEDEKFRRIVQTGQGFKDVDNQAPLFFRTTDEMLAEFEYLGKDKAYEVVVKNTNLVADLMEDILPVPRGTFPPHMEHANEDFERISYERAHEIYGDPLPEIVASRLKRELDSIIGNGYAVLYMIAQKLVWNSNENGYIVGSRGSVGSSFAATMAGITEVNPLQPHYVCPKCKYSDFDSPEVQALAKESMSGFDLPDKKCPVCGEVLKKDGQAIPFETFLGFDGDKEPDIDLNFSGEYQTKAHKFCETLFGKGYVFKAGTISTLQEKTVYGYINKYCEQHDNMYIKSSERKRLALGCEGVKRSTGQHPGGLMVVPSDNDVLNFTPVQRPANDFESDVTTTHFDYHSISGRLLKLDMLGHDVPTILRMFYDITGYDPLNVPLGDKATVSLFTKPDALGVTSEEINCETGSLGLPEFGTHFVRQMLLDTKPTTFSELLRISGLSHGTDVWIGNAADLVHEGTVTLKDVIATRDDIMGYLIQHGIENFTAFTIMEKVRKGRGLSKEYEDLMRENKVPEWYIASCKKIKYLFPKGHAVAYVTNSFRIGYFKINFPHAFYAATFSVKYEDFDYNLLCFGVDKVKAKIAEVESLGKDKAQQKDLKSMPVFELVVEMYARGIGFAPIDLYNSAETKFKVVEDNGEKKLLPPLCTLPGFGITVAESLVEAREQGRFENIEEMQQRTGMGKKMVALLKENGVLDGMRETDQLTIFEDLA